MVYTNLDEYEFFEKKRFEDNELPRWKDIDFIFKEEVFKKIKNRISDKEAIVPKEIWEILKKILYYKEADIASIPNLRKEAINNVPSMKSYIENGEIIPFEKFEFKEGKTLLEATKDVNVSGYSSLYEYFARGKHIGSCGFTSKLMGIMFKDVNFIRSGQALSVIGTENSIGKNGLQGSHAWVEAKINGKSNIIDTSLMLVIPVELKEKMGYRNLRPPMNLDELLQYDDPDEKYYEHYKILSKYSTKAKASDETYKQYIRERKRDDLCRGE